ncbi:MAG: glycosyl hydrolase, repeat protein, partial [Bacteroidetes bacterium]|nr:glycosyl hydrolase, repeat protein [Bacteroidota bacterium]
MVREGKYKVKIIAGPLNTEGQITLIEDPLDHSTKAQKDADYEAVMRSFHMQESLAALMDSVMTEQKLIKDMKDKSPIVKEYYDSLEAIRAELVPVKEGRTVLFVDEEKIRDKISDIYAGVNFYQGEPTSSQVEGLNRLQRDIVDTNKKLETRKKTYRPKINEEYK